MYKAHHISPMIPSFNLQGTRDFFIELLAFESVMNEEAYVILRKDTLTLHLLCAGTDIGQMEFYYGMRKIHIGIPYTNTLLFIGQVIKT